MKEEELKDAIKKGYSMGYDDGFRAACDDMMVHLHNDIVSVLDDMKKSAKDYEVDVIDEYEDEKMKELKFRAWDENKKRYDGSFLIDKLGNTYDVSVEESETKACCAVVGKPNLVIEQYTGLKDKNGKEICVGDIVSEHNGDIVGEIIQKPSGEYCIAWIGIFGGSSVLYDELSMCEVIGNINENPGFLVENNGKKD